MNLETIYFGRCVWIMRGSLVWLKTGLDEIVGLEFELIAHSLFVC